MRARVKKKNPETAADRRKRELAEERAIRAQIVAEEAGGFCTLDDLRRDLADITR